MSHQIDRYFARHLEVIQQAARELSPAVEACAALLLETVTRGGTVLIAGNGGSAADAQHFAAEFVGRFLTERRALPAVALSTDTSILTAVGNDYGFERIFSRQVEALARPGDLFFGISTSGNSPNILRAVESAKERGCKTVALLGRDGGAIGRCVELPIVVPVVETPHIQETHLTIIHLLCLLVESSIGQTDQ